LGRKGGKKGAWGLKNPKKRFQMSETIGEREKNVRKSQIAKKILEGAYSNPKKQTRSRKKEQNENFGERLKTGQSEVRESGRSSLERESPSG